MPKVRKIEDRFSNLPALRITERKGREEGKRRKSPSIRIRCGCCTESVVINYDSGRPFPIDGTLEINGVLASITQWREVLLPLLAFDVKVAAHRP